MKFLKNELELEGAIGNLCKESEQIGMDQQQLLGMDWHSTDAKALSNEIRLQIENRDKEMFDILQQVDLVGPNPVHLQYIISYIPAKGEIETYGTFTTYEAALKYMNELYEIAIEKSPLFQTVYPGMKVEYPDKFTIVVNDFATWHISRITHIFQHQS